MSIHEDKILISLIILVLHAVVNNAGVMVFGEFEWLTEQLIQHQIDVNLLGTLMFSNAICPVLRQHKGTLSIHTMLHLI